MTVIPADFDPDVLTMRDMIDHPPATYQDAVVILERYRDARVTIPDDPVRVILNIALDALQKARDHELNCESYLDAIAVLTISCGWWSTLAEQARYEKDTKRARRFDRAADGMGAVVEVLEQINPYQPPAPEASKTVWARVWGWIANKVQGDQP